MVPFWRWHIGVAIGLAVILGAGIADDLHQEQQQPYHPIVIGHRGAPGYLPDHTLEGYTLAIDSGVDFIEPDLCSTKDGHLIVRHEPNIINTTNVEDHKEFADRKRTVVIDGVEETGFFTHDFTLAEIKTLRAKQPLPERDQSFNGQFQLVTFEEVIAFVQRKSAELHRQIGIYPETKHPTYHRQMGLPIEEKMLAALSAAGLNYVDAPVFIQSFETENLKALHQQTELPLVQLIDGAGIDPRTGNVLPTVKPYDWVVSGRSGSTLDMLTPEGLQEIATYATAVSPWKRYLLKARAAKLDANGAAVDVTGDGVVNEADMIVVPNRQLIRDAHAAKLQVHTWTMRDEAYRLALNYGNDPRKEYRQLFRMHVDGLFSDNCKTAVPVRNDFEANAIQYS